MYKKKKLANEIKLLKKSFKGISTEYFASA